MRRPLQIASAAATTALASAAIVASNTGTSSATASAPAAATHNTQRIVLHQPAESGAGAYLDLGKKGFGLGDREVGRGPLRATRENKRRGSFSVDCAVAKVNRKRETHVSHCTGTAALRRGAITFQGLVYFDPRRPTSVLL